MYIESNIEKYQCTKPIQKLKQRDEDQQCLLSQSWKSDN